MRSYEKIIIIGNIGTAEKIRSKAGNIYLRLSVACNDSDGTTKTTTWYSVVIFGKMAENADEILKYCAKGRLVLVEGRPKVEAYLKKDGTPAVDNSIIAHFLPKYLDGPQQAGVPSAAVTKVPAAA